MWQSQLRLPRRSTKLHGPYWQWTAKADGKTINRRLTQREAELYSEWISNDRQARALLAQMRETAAKAAQLILQHDPAGRVDEV